MRFRRKSTEEVAPADALDTEASSPDTTAGEAEGRATGGEAEGPFDEADVDVEDLECVDLGSLMVTPGGPMEMRLSVDEESGDVLAAVLVSEEGALELRAFAAARGGGSWDELRPQIAEETARMGGQATEEEGTSGTELLCLVPVQTPEGEKATQASRVMGFEGPRWLLRATLMGQPAVDESPDPAWERTIRHTVVRRGREAMPPGTPLPLHLPPEARRVE